MARRIHRHTTVDYPRWVTDPRYSDFLTPQQAADGLAPWFALTAFAKALDDFFHPQGVNWWADERLNSHRQDSIFRYPTNDYEAAELVLGSPRGFTERSSTDVR